MMIGIDEYQWEILERLIIAFFAGVIIGFDRERSGKAAGIRTQMLVCVGSALLASISVFLSKWYPSSNSDPARLMAQIVTGIGFLGAGVIIKNRNKISGVTTAATIWITAAVGISIGAGILAPAFTAVTMVLLLNPLATFQYRYGFKGNYYKIKINLMDEKRLEKVLAQNNSDVRSRTVKDGKLVATIVSSQQRNALLRNDLRKSRIMYDLELFDE